MKKSILMMALFGGLACGKAFAQDTLSVAPPQVAQSVLEKLDHELSLSSQQETEVYALLVERSKKFDQIRGRNKSKILSKASFQQANEQALIKLQQVLTPEQYEKLKALRQETQQQKAAYQEEELYKSTQDIELDF